MPTHYDVLGVPSGAGKDEIKRAYHRLARRHHPDLHHDDGPAAVEAARRRMAAINAAWTVLGDPRRRRAYDRSLGRPGTGPVPTPPPGAGPGHGTDERWLDEGAPAWAVETDVDPRRLGLRSQAVVLVPVGLVAVAAAGFAISTMTGAASLMALSMLLLPVAAVGFVAAPLLMLRRRSRAGD